MNQATIQLTLPEPLRTWVEKQATQAGFQNSSEYVQQVLARERLRHDQASYPAWVDEAILSSGVQLQSEADWTRARGQARKRIDALLLDALSSGKPEEINEEYWEERRRVLTERLGGSKAAGNS